MNNTPRVYQINLRARDDRWQQCRLNHHEKGFPDGFVQRFEACEDSDFGGLGCAKSHVKLLAEFLTQDETPVCIVLEDDFDFRISFTEFAEKLQAVEKSGVQWDVLLLAGTEVLTLDQRVGEMFRVFESHTTSGYIVSRSYVPVLAHCFMESVVAMQRFRHGQPRGVFYGRLAIDQVWKRLQRRDRWYIWTPALGGQRASFSDIEGAFANYAAISH
jgi:glycosyl transferase family 25